MPTGALVVVNQTGQPINGVAISDCSLRTYGFNRLPDGRAIPHGGSYSFTVSAGCWDTYVATTYGEVRHRLHVAANGVMRYAVLPSGG